MAGFLLVVGDVTSRQHRFALSEIHDTEGKPQIIKMSGSTIETHGSILVIRKNTIGIHKRIDLQLADIYYLVTDEQNLDQWEDFIRQCPYLFRSLTMHWVVRPNGQVERL